jgi:hypothetical protein
MGFQVRSVVDATEAGVLAVGAERGTRRLRQGGSSEHDGKACARDSYKQRHFDPLPKHNSQEFYAKNAVKAISGRMPCFAGICFADLQPQ